MEDATVKLCAEMIARQEAVIKKAVNWPVDLKRLACIVNSNDGTETYTLDGVPFVRFHPIAIKQEPKDSGWEIVATRQFEKL